MCLFSFSGLFLVWVQQRVHHSATQTVAWQKRENSMGVGVSSRGREERALLPVVALLPIFLLCPIAGRRQGISVPHLAEVHSLAF